MTAVAPNQSMRGLRVAPNFGRCRKAITISSAAMPIGTLMRKTQRHPEMKSTWLAPANRPPIKGPITDEMPKTARK